jgi:hypothetical protein
VESSSLRQHDFVEKHFGASEFVNEMVLFVVCYSAGQEIAHDHL